MYVYMCINGIFLFLNLHTTRKNVLNLTGLAKKVYITLYWMVPIKVVNEGSSFLQLQSGLLCYGGKNFVSSVFTHPLLLVTRQSNVS